MKVKTILKQLNVLFVMMVASAVSFAHEGMHAAGQAHIGESHMGLMEIALAVIAMIGFGAWALKEVKSKK